MSDQSGDDIQKIEQGIRNKFIRVLDSALDNDEIQPATLKVIESALTKLGYLERRDDATDALMRRAEEEAAKGRLKFKNKTFTTDPTKLPDDEGLTG